MPPGEQANLMASAPRQQRKRIKVYGAGAWSRDCAGEDGARSVVVSMLPPRILWQLDNARIRATNSRPAADTWRNYTTNCTLQALAARAGGGGRRHDSRAVEVQRAERRDSHLVARLPCTGAAVLARTPSTRVGCSMSWLQNCRGRPGGHLRVSSYNPDLTGGQLTPRWVALSEVPAGA